MSHEFEFDERTPSTRTDPPKPDPVKADTGAIGPFDSWDAAMVALRERFPKATDGVLFSVFKLTQNRDLTIRDFRDEAALHGIKIAGRALHSARVLLGLEKPSVRRPNRVKPAAHAEHESAGRSAIGRNHVDSHRTGPDGIGTDGIDLEQSLISVVQQIQASGSAEANRLRDAIRKSMEILQRALDGRDHQSGQ